MSSSSPTSLLDVDLRPGKPPMLRVEATGDAPRWAAEHRDALRAAVAEHGSLLVRGLGLRDVAETEAVFRRLASLMTEKEAFAPRRSYSDGVYSSSKWPPNQPMCMHHELSYVREYLVDIYGEDGLPFNTRFGNGDAIGADVVQLINEVYEANTARERWQAGDLMLVDNVRTAHGRERFEGPREVLVAMADAVHLADRSPTIEVTVS